MMLLTQENKKRREDTMNISIATQCTDKRTRQVGTFGYRKTKFYSVTPVFQDLVTLLRYLKKNNIEYCFDI